MTTLFDMAAAQERDAAIAQVEANADRLWMLDAIETILRLAQGQATLTTDDVWKVGIARPREPRAMGAAMRQAARAGIVEKTKDFVPSVRRHCAMMQVWRSKLYRGN